MNYYFYFVVQALSCVSTDKAPSYHFICIQIIKIDIIWIFTDILVVLLYADVLTFLTKMYSIICTFINHPLMSIPIRKNNKKYVGRFIFNEITFCIHIKYYYWLKEIK